MRWFPLVFLHAFACCRSFCLETCQFWLVFAHFLMKIKLSKSLFLEKTLVKFTRYSNQFINLYIHITYSSLQVIRPTYNCRHWSYTSDSSIVIKNPCARRSFIPLIVGINDKYRDFPFFGGMQPKSPKVDVQKFSKWFLSLNGV